MRLLGARDSQVLLDLGGLGERNFKAEPSRRKGAGPGNAEFQDGAASDGLRLKTSRQLTESYAKLAHDKRSVK